jgi:hypothetical protein
LSGKNSIKKYKYLNGYTILGYMDKMLHNKLKNEDYIEKEFYNPPTLLVKDKPGTFSYDNAVYKRLLDRMSKESLNIFYDKTNIKKDVTLSYKFLKHNSINFIEVRRNLSHWILEDGRKNFHLVVNKHYFENIVNWQSPESKKENTINIAPELTFISMDLCLNQYWSMRNRDNYEPFKKIVREAVSTFGATLLTNVSDLEIAQKISYLSPKNNSKYMDLIRPECYFGIDINDNKGKYIGYLMAASLNDTTKSDKIEYLKKMFSYDYAFKELTNLLLSKENNRLRRV